MMENWDLQAVVGGRSNDAMEDQHLSFEPWSPNFHQHDEQQQQQHPITFPEFFESNPKVLDELEQLYKPFYPDSNPFSTQTLITTSLPVPRDVDHEPTQKPKDQQSFTTADNDSVAKPKRFSRKNQQNKVVQHVTADELPPDVWAWRKYGQKPIKGSPYPRSYYRCSSSKGCLARKQVERSSSDPRVFIITYTAEHCHGHPTRRSSLAGSTRNKSAKKDEPHAETKTAIRDECSLKLKMEELEMVDLDGEEERGKILSPDILLSDESVVRLENFDEGLFGDQFPDLSHEIGCP